MDFLGCLGYNLSFPMGGMFKKAFHRKSLLPPVATASKHHSNPDEDVDGVHVDADGGVDGVEGRCPIVGRVVLCLVDNFLGVVQQEGAKLKKIEIEILEDGPDF